MPVPVKTKIKHYRGDDLRVSFVISQPVDPNDDTQGTTPVDLTGWSVNVTGSIELNETILPDPLDATGEITVTVPHTTLGDDAPGEVQFDVQLIDPTGFQQTYRLYTVVLEEQV